MSWVVCRVRRSVNAACKHLSVHDALPVCVDAVYDKLARVETQTSAALVRYTAQGGHHRPGTASRQAPDPAARLRPAHRGRQSPRGYGAPARRPTRPGRWRPAWRGRCRPQPAKPPDRGRGAQRRRPRSGMRSVCLPFAEIACASVVARRPPLLYQPYPSSASPDAGRSSSSVSTPDTCVGGWSAHDVTAAGVIREKSTSKR